MLSWLICFFRGHDWQCLGRSEMQGELWTVYDYHCRRCGQRSNTQH